MQIGASFLEQDDFVFESSSHSGFLVEHDLFPKTGIHFSGSCSSIDGVLARAAEGA
jgi:hypothetical protein